MNILERYHAMDYAPAPEARDQADAWLRARDFAACQFIGGEWVSASGGQGFAVTEPATGRTLAELSEASAEDVDAAVAAARKA